MPIQIERSQCGSGGCITCPFSINGEAEQAQNYGCLPDSFEIIKMNKKYGVNWACHSDNQTICGGFAQSFVNGYYERFNEGLAFDKSAPLVRYEDWYYLGEEASVALAYLRSGRDYVQELIKQGQKRYQKIVQAAE